MSILSWAGISKVSWRVSKSGSISGSMSSPRSWALLDLQGTSGQSGVRPRHTDVHQKYAMLNLLTLYAGSTARAYLWTRCIVTLLVACTSSLAYNHDNRQLATWAVQTLEADPSSPSKGSHPPALPEMSNYPLAAAYLHIYKVCYQHGPQSTASQILPSGHVLTRARTS